MKTLPFLAVVVVGLALAACATAAPTAEPLPTEAAEAITFTIGADMLEQLLNLDYTIDGEIYPLVDGAYVGDDPGRPVTIDLFPPAAVGDLNGDGVDDAAVLLAVSTGGSGVFAQLAAVVDRDGALVNIDTIALEDRVQVGEIAIAGGVITLGVVAHGPDDPMCCPSKAATWTYGLEDGTLVLTSSAGPMTPAAP